jgi:heparosan-N-sulfate-glucuronate 5-epimerase
VEPRSGLLLAGSREGRNPAKKVARGRTPEASLLRVRSNAFQWAWSAALSRGTGYEPQPLGHFSRIDEVHGYFIDFSAKTKAPSATQPLGLSPAALAQLALGWWERSLHGDPHALGHFERVCTLLEGRAVPRGAELRWPYDEPVPKYGLHPPWYSALAQGQAASVFARAYVAWGHERHRMAALAAIQPLLANGPSDLVTNEDSCAVLEEAPSSPPSHILNGWIYALWGLWEIHVAFAHEASADAFSASMDCLRRSLPKYDVGWWTKYSLYPFPLTDLAKPFYHALHVHQLDILYRLTGFRDLLETRSRWSSYDTPTARARVVVQKAGFVATRMLTR